MEDDLYHYGISGMKWHLRRFQNKDGTYTEEGKERRRKFAEKAYKAFDQSVKQGKDKPNTSPAGQIARSTGQIADNLNRIVRRSTPKKTENLSKYSNEELRNKVNRLQLEKQYRDLSDNKINSGMQTVSDVLDTIGDVAAIGVSAAMIFTMIQQIRKG